MHRACTLQSACVVGTGVGDGVGDGDGAGVFSQHGKNVLPSLAGQHSMPRRKIVNQPARPYSA